MSSLSLEAKTSTIILDPEEEASARLAGTLAGTPGETFAHTSGEGEFNLTSKGPLGFQPPHERGPVLSAQEQIALAILLKELRGLLELSGGSNTETGSPGEQS